MTIRTPPIVTLSAKRELTSQEGTTKETYLALRFSGSHLPSYTLPHPLDSFSPFAPLSYLDSLSPLGKENNNRTANLSPPGTKKEAWGELEVARKGLGNDQGCASPLRTSSQAWNRDLFLRQLSKEEGRDELVAIPPLP